jgi:transposase
MGEDRAALAEDPAGASRAGASGVFGGRYSNPPRRRPSRRSKPRGTAAVSRLAAAPAADKGQDADAFRAWLERRKIRVVIPGKFNRKKQIRHAGKAYKRLNVVARRLGRLEDFRRIATRHDKRATNFFPAVCFVAIVAYWLRII